MQIVYMIICKGSDYNMHAMLEKDNKQKKSPNKYFGNTGIPRNVQAGFERYSGYSLNDVSVHYNSDKPAQLQAYAYTSGNQIYIGPGQNKYLNHELGHVIQQKQGRVKPTFSFKGIDINDSSYMEREADSIAGFALSGELHKSNGQQTNGYTKVIQRQPFERPFEELDLKNNTARWFNIAEDYEKRVGVFAYEDGRANYAVESGLFKILQVLTKAGEMEDIPEEAKIHAGNVDDEIRTFFKDDIKSAGQTGKEHDFDELNKILFRGNLREKMTAFYNAAYYNCGYGEGVTGLKALLQHIIFEKKSEKVRELRLDEDEYKKFETYFDTSYRKSAELLLILCDKAKVSKKYIVDLFKQEDDKQEIETKAYLFSKDLFAMGNISSVSEHWIKDLYEITLSQMHRFERDEAGRELHAKSEQDYEDMGVPLSAEELRFVYSYRESPLYDLFTTDEEKARDEAEDKVRPLPWLEGVKLFDIKPEAAWFKEVHDQLKIPVVAGVSGTTARMLTAFKFLKVGGTTPLNFRLAIMGWMLTSRDHSLYEILRGSHMAGIKPPGEEEGVKDVTRMYVNIAPLSKAELRGIADHGLFPHELMYKELSEGGDETLYPRMTEAIPDLTAAKADPLLNHYYDALNEAQAIAIRGYTTGMHVLLNTVLAYPEQDSLMGSAAGAVSMSAEDRIYKELCKQALAYMETGRKPDDFIKVLTPFEQSFKNINVFKLNSDLLKFDAHKNVIITVVLKSIASELYSALKLHANMIYEGLEELPPYTGVVYRGDWRADVLSSYQAGKTVTLSSFTSYSKDINEAVEFAEAKKRNWYSDAVLIRLLLNGTYGKDISQISEYSAEEEVLLSPGDKIKYVAQSSYDTGTRKILLLDAVEA